MQDITIERRQDTTKFISRLDRISRLWKDKQTMKMERGDVDESLC